MMNNNNEENTKKTIEKTYRLEKQVENWDLFAKIAPTIFLIVCFVLLAIGSVSFDTVFYIGMVLFALTAVVWWFWTIFSIRFLVRTLRRASIGLIEVTSELVNAKKELKEIVRHEENNRSKSN